MAEGSCSLVEAEDTGANVAVLNSLHSPSGGNVVVHVEPGAGDVCREILRSLGAPQESGNRPGPSRSGQLVAAIAWIESNRIRRIILNRAERLNLSEARRIRSLARAGCEVWLVTDDVGSVHSFMRSAGMRVTPEVHPLDALRRFSSPANAAKTPASATGSVLGAIAEKADRWMLRAAAADALDRYDFAEVDDLMTSSYRLAAEALQGKVLDRAFLEAWIDIVTRAPDGSECPWRSTAVRLRMMEAGVFLRFQLADRKRTPSRRRAAKVRSLVAESESALAATGLSKMQMSWLRPSQVERLGSGALVCGLRLSGRDAQSLLALKGVAELEAPGAWGGGSLLGRRPVVGEPAGARTDLRKLEVHSLGLPLEAALMTDQTAVAADQLAPEDDSEIAEAAVIMLALRRRDEGLRLTPRSISQWRPELHSTVQDLLDRGVLVWWGTGIKPSDGVNFSCMGPVRKRQL